VGEAVNVHQHLALLTRLDRTLMLRRAVFETVRQGDVVLDAGTGSGILAIWAAQAGAAKVVAVDRDDLELARQLAIDNGVADRISFVRDDLGELDLPELTSRVDVMLAMLYLNDPRRDARASELAFDLKDRYLKEGGRMVPDGVRYEIAACDWPAHDLQTRRKRVAQVVRQIEERIGVNLVALTRATDTTIDKGSFPPRASNGSILDPSARLLTEYTSICTIDYQGTERQPLPHSKVLSITAPGILNALVWTQSLMWRDLSLFSNESLTWVANPTAVVDGDNVSIEVAEDFSSLARVWIAPVG
jgi:SAM-dependent methyltransferase